jgi:HK97 gp10 family phage protein
MQVNLEPTANTQRLIQKLGNASAIVRNAKVQGLTQASMIFQTKSKQEAPVDTSNLRRNIKYEVESNGSQAKVYVDPTIKYGLYQEEGTGIYGSRHAYIVPRTAKYLAWKSKTGAMVFAKRVRGVMGKWYMRKGSEYLISQNKKIDQTIYNELVKGLS